MSECDAEFEFALPSERIASFLNDEEGACSVAAAVFEFSSLWLCKDPQTLAEISKMCVFVDLAPRSDERIQDTKLHRVDLTA